MCYKGKCCLSIPVEKACFILAIIKAVLMAIMLLVCVGLMIAYAPFEITGPLALFSSFTFTFCLLLCNGIRKRQPGQVMAYFIFGLVVVILETLAVVVGVSITGSARVGVLGTLGIALHSLFILLVHHTYNTLFDSEKQDPLVLDCFKA